MATFTVDLLTGNVYLFSGDFLGSGGTSPTPGSTYPEVNLYSELPDPTAHSGEIYVVRSSSGEYILNRKEAGLYFSNGVLWRRLGNIPSFFTSDNFQIIDYNDTTKIINFDLSGITTNNVRTLKVQDSDGTIAYLTDLNSKVDLSVFNDYTANTAPNTFVDWTTFNSYTGNTLSLINAKQDKLIEGDYISINNNVISVTGLTGNVDNALQLIDTIGGQSVNNIESTPIEWTDVIYSGSGLSYTGGSRIYILEDGIFGISYVVNVNNNTSGNKNVGILIRKNGDTDVTPLSSASISLDEYNDTGTNVMPEYKVELKINDYIELIGFRIGSAGTAYTIPNGSWIKIKKL